MTLAKKSGESKTLPSIIENTSTPELSPSNSRVSSPTPTATHSTLPSSANQPPSDFKYTVRDIPAYLATQKAFYNLLVVTLGLKSIQLRVNYNKTALVITKAPLAPKFVKTLQVAANSPTITIAPHKSETPGPASASKKKPTFSVVVRDVPQDISAEEIAALCPPLSIVKAWRIVSRKSNRPTSFIRVLSTDKLTVDYMLINGIVLYGRTFECETSHPPTPTPLQCPRCFQFGHGQAECTKKAICPKCPESHPPNRCPAREPSCNGPHPAWSRACPSFKQILVTDETPVLPVKIIDPLTAIAEPTDSDSDLAQDKISILAISETHTVKSIVVPKFHCYQRNSEINPTRSGGVALLVAQNLASTPHTLPNHLNHLEAVAANLHLQNMPILIISYYNRPQDRVSADLLRYAAQHNFAIVLGDFNARHTDFGDTQTNPNGRSLNSLIITLPLCRLHNTDPTFLSHTGCSISDHILSTENFVPFLYPHCSIGTTVTFDHVPLKTHLLLDGPPPPPAFIPITNFKQADWQKFQQLVSDNLPVIAPTVDFLTVDRQVAQFIEVIKTAQSQSVPRKFIPINKRPIPARILALIREKRRVYRSFIQTRDPALKTIFNRLNAQVRRDLNRFREEQWIDSCRLLDYRNGKKFWTQFQTLTGQKTTTVHHLVRNNAIINTPLEKANCFAETLEQIHQVPNDPHFDDAFFAQVIRSVNNFRRNPPTSASSRKTTLSSSRFYRTRWKRTSSIEEQKGSGVRRT
jgi:hypothetical protein